MKKIISPIALGGLLITLNHVAFAQNTANYNFDTVPFNLTSYGPFTNAAPSSGNAPGVLASFSGSQTKSLQVDDNADGGKPADAYFSSQFSGQFLESVKSDASILVTLNQPFNAVSFNFFLDAPGMVDLTAANSGVPVASYSQSGTFDTISTSENYIGLVTFSSPEPFTSFTLSTSPASNVNGPASFGIDNLSLTKSSAVPAPGSALVLGVGMLCLLTGILRRRKTSVAEERSP